ncbi:MAG: metallophosphoesterase, partial [Actinobacteria bacterium]|nr:metallophosphoesterase [Actinomycetota bacterium]
MWLRLSLVPVVVAATALLLGWVVVNEAAAYPTPEETKIRELIFPTLGNPAVVKKGQTLEVEWDFRDGDPGVDLPASVGNWAAELNSSSSPCPQTLQLEFAGATLAPSTRWPVYCRTYDSGDDAPEAPGYGDLGYDIYKVTFNIPGDIPEGLYELTVSAEADGATVARTTHHSVKVVDEFKDDYWIAAIADPHFNDGRGEDKTYAGDPEVVEYRTFKKAVDIINHLDVEFVVFMGDVTFGVPNSSYSVFIPSGMPKPEVDIYDYEYSTSYEIFKMLEHPVVVTIGNHDGYFSDCLDDEGFRYFQDFFAPLYRGWDYGNKAHVTVLNTMDWSSDARKPTICNLIGNDCAFIDTFSYAPTLYYRGKIRYNQRNWMPGEMASGAGSPLTLVSQHHAPLGSNDGWHGGAPGKDELLQALKDNNVDGVLHGHAHGDEIAYDTGNGNTHTIHMNTTSTTMDIEYYPGFRLLHIVDGVIESYGYYPDAPTKDKWSVPTYAETEFPPPSPTSSYLSSFETPLLDSHIIDSDETVATWQIGADAYDWTQKETDISQRVTSHFAQTSPQASVNDGGRMTFFMPYTNDKRYYKVNTVTNGPINGYSFIDSTGYRVFDVDVDLPAGLVTEVRVHAVSDTEGPSLQVAINNGAKSCDSLDVKLDLQAQYEGAPVTDVMVSNDHDFAGAEWTAWDGNSMKLDWTLSSGPSGERRVYARCRDAVMPPNVTESVASIDYDAQPSTLYYFAEGTCRPGFDSYICLQNPESTDAEVTITYMLGDGTTRDQEVTVGATSRYTVMVKDILGEGDDASYDFSARVQSTNGVPIVVERPIYFNYQGNTRLNWPGGHNVIGTTNPSTSYYFAEGTCRPGFDPYICLQNPESTDAEVTITYMLGDGTTRDQEVTVGATSRYTVMVKDILGEGDDVLHDFSCLVDSTNGVPIVAERPIYFNYQGYTRLNWTGGHNVIGATCTATSYYFAEGTCRPGFDPYVCIQNPEATDAEVTITYMLGDGTTRDQEVTVGATSRYTVMVKDILGEGDD